MLNTTIVTVLIRMFCHSIYKHFKRTNHWQFTN